MGQGETVYGFERARASERKRGRGRVAEGREEGAGREKGKGKREAWRQIESRARRDCPGEHRRGSCMVKITTRLRPQYVLPTLRESRGISQRRIPRRLVDVNVVVAVSATRRVPPRLLEFSST